MSLHSPKSFDRYVLSLKAVEVTLQWGGHAAKIGGKVFALCGDDGEHIVFKVSEMAFEGLTAIEGISQAPYFAKRAWVSVGKDALGDKDLKAYIAESYRTVASKLTRKTKAELALDL